MILSDGEIKEAIKSGRLVIDPLPADEQYTTSAVDLLLGDEALEHVRPEELQAQEPPGVDRDITIDPTTVNIPQLLRRYSRPLAPEADGSFILKPGQFALGITRERVELPKPAKLAARVEGRSTLARLGLIVHLTAPVIHCGFSGKIALEMRNLGYYSIRLRPGRLAICQLVFERLGRIPTGAVRTTYQKQKSLR